MNIYNKILTHSVISSTLMSVPLFALETIPSPESYPRATNNITQELLSLVEDDRKMPAEEIAASRDISSIILTIKENLQAGQNIMTQILQVLKDAKTSHKEHISNYKDIFSAELEPEVTNIVANCPKNRNSHKTLQQRIFAKTLENRTQIHKQEEDIYHRCLSKISSINCNSVQEEDINILQSVYLFLKFQQKTSGLIVDPNSTDTADDNKSLYFLASCCRQWILDAFERLDFPEDVRNLIHAFSFEHFNNKYGIRCASMKFTILSLRREHSVYEVYKQIDQKHPEAQLVVRFLDHNSQEELNKFHKSSTSLLEKLRAQTRLLDDAERGVNASKDNTDRMYQSCKNILCQSKSYLKVYDEVYALGEEYTKYLSGLRQTQEYRSVLKEIIRCSVEEYKTQELQKEEDEIRRKEKEEIIAQKRNAMYQKLEESKTYFLELERKKEAEGAEKMAATQTFTSKTDIEPSREHNTFSNELTQHTDHRTPNNNENAVSIPTPKQKKKKHGAVSNNMPFPTTTKDYENEQTIPEAILVTPQISEAVTNVLNECNFERAIQLLNEIPGVKVSRSINGHMNKFDFTSPLTNQYIVFFMHTPHGSQLLKKEAAAWKKFLKDALVRAQLIDR